MESTNTEVFLRAKEFFYRNTAITLKYEQEKQFSSVLAMVIEKLKSNNTVELDDDKTFNLPRRGGKTFCLSHLVAIGIISLKAKFRVIVASKTLQRDFFCLVEKYLHVFKESDEFSYQTKFYGFPNGINVESKKKKGFESGFDIIVVEKPQKLSPLESKFQEIQTTLSPQFREIASILLGFTHAQILSFSLKEEDGLLKIDLSRGLELIVTPQPGGKHRISFKSFITQSFNYPEQIPEIVSSLQLFQKETIVKEIPMEEGLAENMRSFMIMRNLVEAMSKAI